MGALRDQDKFYFNEFSKYQLKNSLTWMKVIAIVGFLATAALYFFTFEFFRNEVFNGSRLRDDEIIAMIILITATGLFTAIFTIMWSSIRLYSEFLKDGNPLTLQAAITRKKSYLLVIGILAILAAIGILWLLSAYVYFQLLRRW